MKCLTPATLQERADGLLTADLRDAADLHLRTCSDCRDGLRALQRVEGYLRHGRAAKAPRSLAESVLDRALAGQFAAPRAAPAFEGRPDVAATVVAARPWRRRLAAAAALVVALLVLSGGPGVERLPVLARGLEASMSPGGSEGNMVRPQTIRSLRLAWRMSLDAEDRLRVIRAAARDKVVGFRARAERLAITASAEQLESAVFAVAGFGDDEAARSLMRVAGRRPLRPGMLAEAFIRTGSDRVADRVWALLSEDERGRDESYVQLHRLRGRRASRIFVAAYIGGDGSAALRRVITERPTALARLRTELSSVSREGRTRILTLLGEAGDREAVPLLERGLGSEDTWYTAVHALKRVAHAGSHAALLALARALPLLEDAADWSASREALALGHVLREMRPGTGAMLLNARRATRRASARRRYLVAAGLTGDPSVRSALEAALSRAQERRAALLALAVLGERSAVAAIRPYSVSRDRGTRRCALASLAILGGSEAATLLSMAMRNSCDRRTVISCVRFTADRWVSPVFVDGLCYRDTREDCLRGLRRIVGGRGPRSADPRAWRAWFGLDLQNPERT